MSKDKDIEELEGTLYDVIKAMYDFVNQIEIVDDEEETKTEETIADRLKKFYQQDEDQMYNELIQYIIDNAKPVSEGGLIDKGNVKNEIVMTILDKEIVKLYTKFVGITGKETKLSKFVTDIKAATGFENISPSYEMIDDEVTLKIYFHF